MAVEDSPDAAACATAGWAIPARARMPAPSGEASLVVPVSPDASGSSVFVAGAPDAPLALARIRSAPSVGVAASGFAEAASPFADPSAPPSPVVAALAASEFRLFRSDL